VRTEARFPGVEEAAGHYESLYLKSARPGGGQAIWIRHTVHKPPGAEPTASVWLTAFDVDAPGPRAAKVTVPAAELSVPAGAYVEVDGAVLEPGRAAGRISTATLEASWELSFADKGEAFFHLPYRRLYAAPLPRTKLLSPYPSARFDGAVQLGDAAIEVNAWPGMIGHNWGSEHAERWVWIQGSELAGQPQSCFDVAAGRIRLGPLRTPWVANGVLRLDGVEHRLGGLGKLHSTKIDEAPTACGFELSGGGATVRGRVSSEPRNFVAWVYADPEGPEHNTLNCSVADLELEVIRKGRQPARLEVAAAAAYEIGMRETDHGIPLQPYPDG
jgi:hypothetical protein